MFSNIEESPIALLMQHATVLLAAVALLVTAEILGLEAYLYGDVRNLLPLCAVIFVFSSGAAGYCIFYLNLDLMLLFSQLAVRKGKLHSDAQNAFAVPAE